MHFTEKDKIKDIIKCNCFGKFLPWFIIRILRNDDVVLAVSDEDKKIASCHEKFLNTEFAWDKNSLSQADIISGLPRLIHKEMVRASVSVMKNRKAAGRSVVMWEMVLTAGEARFDITACLVNQIIVEGDIPAELDRVLTDLENLENSGN